VKTPGLRKKKAAAPDGHGVQSVVGGKAVHVTTCGTCGQQWADGGVVVRGPQVEHALCERMGMHLLRPIPRATTGGEDA
jgi:hypothetical protein